MNSLKKHRLWLFFVLAYFISWLLWTASVLNTYGKNIPDILLLISNFALLGPMIAALILKRTYEGKGSGFKLIKSSWNWKFNKLWLIPTLLLPAAMIALTMIIKMNVEDIRFAITDVQMPIPIFIIVLFFVGGPLEEFGWRGYVLPKLLARYSFIVSSIILGVLHGLWHLPLHFMEDTVQSAIPIWEFIAVTAVGTFIYTWIYINTNGNLMLMILHHWAGNLSAALLMYWDTSLGRWIFFGIQLVVVILITLLVSNKPMLKWRQVQSNTLK